MIGKLTGIVCAIYADNTVLLDVQGVGYIVICSAKTLEKLPTVGSIGSLLIEMLTSESGAVLYGFLEEREKLCFKHLRSIQGIGGRMAVSILSLLSVDDVINAILTADNEAFQRISGIGCKLATRIITELKNNKSLLSIPSAARAIASNDTLGGGSTTEMMMQDVVSAITKLGFSRSIVAAVANKVCRAEPNLSFEELVRRTLASLGRS